MIDIDNIVRSEVEEVWRYLKECVRRGCHRGALYCEKRLWKERKEQWNDDVRRLVDDRRESLQGAVDTVR